MPAVPTRPTGTSGAGGAGRRAFLRLVGLFVLLSLAPLALLAYSSTTLADDAVSKEVTGRLHTTATVSVVVLEREMHGLVELVQSYAQRPHLVAALGHGDPAAFDSEAIGFHLGQLVQARSGISGAFVTDVSGRLTDAVPPTPGIVGRDFSFRDWYEGLTRTGEPYVSEAYRTAIVGNPLVVAVAAYARAPGEGGRPGRPIGILAATYRLDALRAFAQNVAGAQGVGLTVTDQQGTVLAGPGASVHTLVSRRDAPVQAALGGGTGVTRVGGRRGEVVTAYAPVRGLRWAVTASLPARTAFSAVDRLRSTVLTITAVLALVLLAGLAWLARSQRQRREAERTLRSSEERTRAILESANDAFVSMDEGGRITAWNHRAEELFGWPASEALGRPLADTVVPARFREGHAAGLAHFLETGEGTILNRTVELSAVRGDGQELQVEAAVFATCEDGTYSFHAFLRDLTERKRAEEAMSRLAAIVDSSEDAIIGKTLDGTIVSWNRGAERLYGYSREEAVGRNIAMLVPPDHADELPAILGRVSRGEATENHETTRVRKDGTTVPVALTVSPVRDGAGTIVGASTIARDISTRQRAERALAEARDQAMEGSRLKSEFLANMSHEIRTPMNGVIGMTALLLDTPLSPEQREYAETARHSGEALLSLINDILDFSKVEAGMLEFEHIDFDLRSVVEDAIGILAAPAQSKGLELVSLVPADVPSALQGDPGRLRQVLTNLVGNAVKFTEHGEVVVRVSVVGDAEERVTVRFEVADTGIGVAPEYRGGLFTAFSQADSSTTRRYGGTGLGLAISARLVELMDGAIGVDSEPGAGSTFWFTARFEKASERSVAWTPTPRQDLAGLRVLVVDDNETNRAVLSQMLTAWSMRPWTSTGGREAMASLRSAASRGEPFDVVVVDLNMPEMDGLEVARAINADAELGRPRLVMLTSTAQLGEVRRAADAGIAGYLTKPVRQSQLYDCLATVTGDSGPAPAMVTRQRLVEARGRARARLLVAEDNLVNQKVATRTLEAMGFRVDVATDGVDAVRAVASGSYAAVLMDCQMPRMDGYEATAVIRDQEGERRRTPIIAMTASAMEGDRDRCLAAGMDDYLAKPLRADQLRAALHRWVGEGLPASGDAARTDGGAGVGVVLDAGVVAELRTLTERAGFDVVGEVLDLFRRDTPTRLQRLRQALAEGDGRGVAELAHTLKGSTASLGALEMTAACRRLEALAQDGQLGPAPDVLDQLEALFEPVLAALEKALASSERAP